MEKSANVDQYILKHPTHKELLILLRSVLTETALEETIKWGAPTYTLNNKNVVGLGAFKNHVALWFFQGCFLSNEHGLLKNAQEGKTKAMRQIRLNSNDHFDIEVLKTYIDEAIENQKKGLELKPQRKSNTILIPKEFQPFLDDNKALNTCFYELTPGKQREYIEHINSAKRESTKMSRIDKIIPLILDKKGLYDKYKNC